MQTSISKRAPVKERQPRIAEAIATEPVTLHRQACDFAATKQLVHREYTEIVPACDRSWMSEEFYS